MAELYEKVVVVTKQTPLEELIARLGTPGQARFYLHQEAARAAADGNADAAPRFEEYAAEDAAYQTARAAVRVALGKTRAQWVDRALLPTFTFGERDLVVTLGPDGLVVNTAKYLRGQPIVAINPDPARVDGVLLPWSVAGAQTGLTRALTRPLPRKTITMAQARLQNGQRLLAVNDLFIGRKTHASARYRLHFGDSTETQSSSGIIVSTGAGSTGWLRSLAVGAAGLAGAFTGEPVPDAAETAQAARFAWDKPRLRFCVREPWLSRANGAALVAGNIGSGDTLLVVSQMPQNGVIFSDGVEEDYLPFDSGAVAHIGIAAEQTTLLCPA